MSLSILKDFFVPDKLYKYKRKFFPNRPNVPPAAMASSPRSMFMSFVSTKGLSNNAGENNCFLNSAVQILWHLDAFRKSFRLLSHHACLENSCIFCALKVIFTQFEFSEEKVLPPVALRKALAVAFEDQQRFQIGFMDDAAECFENILTRIHFHLSNGSTDDNCTLEHCIPHQKFAMTVIEQNVCSCGETSEPLPFVQFIHYVTAHTIISLSQNAASGTSFSHKLRIAQRGDSLCNECPGKCGRQARLNRTLTNVPDVVSIGLVWDSAEQTAEQVKNFVTAIETDLHLQSLFDCTVDLERAEASQHKLVGMVCYYGKHYSVFFLHSKTNNWMSCDDATVTDLGPNWHGVVEKCHRGRYQPLLLLYQNPSGECISTKSAPKTTTILTDALFNPLEDSKKSETAKKIERNVHTEITNSNNSCSYSFPPKTTAYGREPTATPRASSALLVDIDRSSEASRSMSAPSVAKPTVGREVNAGVQARAAAPSNSGILSQFQSFAGDSFGSNRVQSVPTATGNCYHQPRWLPIHGNVLPYQRSAVATNVSPNGTASCYAPMQLGGPQNYAAPMVTQYPNQLTPQFVVSPFSSTEYITNCSHSQNFNLPGSNLGGVPTPYSATDLQISAGAYLQPYSQSDDISANRWQTESAQIPRFDCPTTSPSELNLLEWSIIDRNSFQSSPGATSGLVNSDSTSSLYDNLSDFGISSTDDKMFHQGPNPLSSVHSPPLLRNTSLTESYYFVPDAKSLNGFTDDKSIKDLIAEADCFIAQSEVKERSGDLQAALICCNQANSLYATAQRQASNVEVSELSDVDLKRMKSFNQSTLLSQQIEINQQKSKSDTKNKSGVNCFVSNQPPPSDISNRTNLAPTEADLIFLDEQHTPTTTPKYQVLKDSLPHLYKQNYSRLNVVQK